MRDAKGRFIGKMEPEIIEKRNATRKLNGWHSDDAKRNISKSRIGKTWVKENARKMGLMNIGRKKSEKAINSDRLASLKKWSDPEYKNKTIHAIMKGNGTIGPNTQELILNKYIQNVCSEYKFTGNGDIILGGKCPDFVNMNGQKKIIELFGSYWHGEKKSGRSNVEEENLKKSHFSTFGYQTLIIWEQELKNPSQVMDKIRKFTYGGK